MRNSLSMDTDPLFMYTSPFVLFTASCQQGARSSPVRQRPSRRAGRAGSNSARPRQGSSACGTLTHLDSPGTSSPYSARHDARCSMTAVLVRCRQRLQPATGQPLAWLLRDNAHSAACTAQGAGCRSRSNTQSAAGGVHAVRASTPAPKGWMRRSCTLHRACIWALAFLVSSPGRSPGQCLGSGGCCQHQALCCGAALRDGRHARRF